jgi:hypothetical protein
MLLINFCYYYLTVLTVYVNTTFFNENLYFFVYTGLLFYVFYRNLNEKKRRRAFYKLNNKNTVFRIHHLIHKRKTKRDRHRKYNIKDVIYHKSYRKYLKLLYVNNLFKLKYFKRRKFKTYTAEKSKEDNSNEDKFKEKNSNEDKFKEKNSNEDKSKENKYLWLLFFDLLTVFTFTNLKYFKQRKVKTHTFENSKVEYSNEGKFKEEKSKVEKSNEDKSKVDKMKKEKLNLKKSKKSNKLRFNKRKLTTINNDDDITNVQIYKYEATNETKLETQNDNSLTSIEIEDQIDKNISPIEIACVCLKCEKDDHSRITSTKCDFYGKSLAEVNKILQQRKLNTPKTHTKTINQILNESTPNIFDQPIQSLSKRPRLLDNQVIYNLNII